jgi:hypothetical protein
MLQMCLDLITIIIFGRRIYILYLNDILTLKKDFVKNSRPNFTNPTVILLNSNTIITLKMTFFIATILLQYILVHVKVEIGLSIS